MTDPADTARQAQTSAWFETLRDQICDAFEKLEDAYAAERGGAAGRFERAETRRAQPGDAVADQGGGVMSVMRGQVFEKVGVNVSTVYGRLSEAACRALTSRKEVPGLTEDPRFWASGVSLVAHLANPRAPAAHMNTRFSGRPAQAGSAAGAISTQRCVRKIPPWPRTPQTFTPRSRRPATGTTRTTTQSSRRGPTSTL